MLFSGVIPRQLCRCLGNLSAETPSLVFASVCVSLVCALLASKNLCLSSSHLSYLILCGILCPVSLSLCLLLCLCLSPSTSTQASWYLESYLGAEVPPGLSHVLAILELFFPSQAKLGVSNSAVKVLPPLSSKFLSLLPPPLILGRMFLEEGNLIPFVG